MVAFHFHTYININSTSLGLRITLTAHFYPCLNPIKHLWIADHGLKSKGSKLLGILKLLAIFSNISAGSACLKDIMLQYISQNYNTARSKTKIIDLTGQRQVAVKSLKPRKSPVNNPLINFKRPCDLQLTLLCLCYFCLFVADAVAAGLEFLYPSWGIGHFAEW